MGLGTGVGLIAVGAVLTWALDVDLPYVEDDLLGAILLVVGAVTLVAAAAMNAQRPGADPSSGVALATAGAALVWAIDVDIPYVYDAALGAILLIGGLVTIVAAVAMSRPRAPRTRRELVYRP